MAARQVRALLMGGQACVFYGAAEFSRDADLIILCEPANLRRIEEALTDLQAVCIAVPTFDAAYLERGHAVHFRCQHPEASRIRVDLMSRLRGVDPFPLLWGRRTTLRDEDGGVYELLALPDLVQAKKTQRDKDWPMLRRLLEAHYLQHRDAPTDERIDFWLRELRTPELLSEAASLWPEPTKRQSANRSLLKNAATATPEELLAALEAEAAVERENDRRYWAPLKRELEALRHA